MLLAFQKVGVFNTTPCLQLKCNLGCFTFDPFCESQSWLECSISYFYLEKCLVKYIRVGISNIMSILEAMFFNILWRDANKESFIDMYEVLKYFIYNDKIYFCLYFIFN